MANMRGKVCLNHTDTLAVSRCETCFRPLCEECIMEAADRHFCSEKCAGDFFDKTGRIAVLEARNAATQRWKMVKNLITAAVVIALAVGCFIYWQGHKKEVAQKIALAKKQAEMTMKQAEKAADKLSDAAVKKMTLPPPGTNNPIRNRGTGE